MVTRRACPHNRWAWRSITLPARASPIRRKFLRSDRVLKARQRRLRGQIKSRNRIAVEQQLVNRIGTQTGRVVGVGIAAGERRHPLRKKLLQRMIDVACLPLVWQASSQAANQPVAALGSLQQDGSAIRTALPLLELQYGGAVR